MEPEYKSALEMLVKIDELEKQLAKQAEMINGLNAVVHDLEVKLAKYKEKE